MDAKVPRETRSASLSKASISPTLNQLRGLAPAYATLFGFSFLTPILFLATPIYMQQVMDRVALSRNETTLFALFAAFIFLTVMSGLLTHIRTKTLRRLGISIDERLSSALFQAMHRERVSSKLQASPIVMGDLNTVREFLSGGFVGAIYDALWAPLFIAAMFIMHPFFGLLALLLLAITTSLSLLNFFLSRPDGARYQAAAIKATEFSNAVARMAEVARALGMLPRLRGRWMSFHRAMLGWQGAQMARTDTISAAVRIVRLVQPILVITLGALLYLHGEIGISSMVFAMLIMMRGLGPIDQMIASWRDFQFFSASLGRLDDVLVGALDERTKTPLAEPSGGIHLNRVFAVPPGSDKFVLNDVTFSLAAGRVLAVVGPSGAGKSCLGRVLVGIWTPRRGNVILGVNDLSHWDQDELGRHLGYVPQDIDLLPGTVAENISRFEPPSAEQTAALHEAVEIAGIQDLITALPQGHNTLLGPSGHVLSGGQRQRIALARAVYRCPRLVVMDEPNSNLDAVGEQGLARAIQRLRSAGSTVIIVTHKLSLLGLCDDVLVLNSGAVQAFGAREQIVSRLPKLGAAAPQLTVIEGAGDGRRG
jgi:PrtD family type I secretion system ABC transporter